MSQLSTINYSVCNEESALASITSKLNREAVEFQHHIAEQLASLPSTAKLYTFVLMTHL